MYVYLALYFSLFSCPLFAFKKNKCSYIFFFQHEEHRFRQNNLRVMTMTGLKKMMGMPVILNGRAIGSVARGVLSEDGRSLRGIVVRGGLRGTRWLPREKITLVGRVSVIASGKPTRAPKDTSYHLFRVSDAEGARLGVVTDALFHEETLRVAALEISGGPIDDLIDGRWYATAFHVQPRGEFGHVTVPYGREEVKNG